MCSEYEGRYRKMPLRLPPERLKVDSREMCETYEFLFIVNGDISIVGGASEARRNFVSQRNLFQG